MSSKSYFTFVLSMLLTLLTPVYASAQDVQEVHFAAFADITSNPQDPHVLAAQGKNAAVIMAAYQLGLVSYKVAYVCAYRADGCALSAASLKKLIQKVKQIRSGR